MIPRFLHIKEVKGPGQCPKILVYLEFLVANTLSYHVILNYMSALKCMAGVPPLWKLF